MTKVTKLACVNRGGPLRQGAKAERPTQTTEPNAQVEISPTGTSLCGVVVWIGRCPAEPDQAAMRAVATCIHSPQVRPGVEATVHTRNMVDSRPRPPWPLIHSHPHNDRPGQATRAARSGSALTNSQGCRRARRNSQDLWIASQAA